MFGPMMILQVTTDTGTVRILSETIPEVEGVHIDVRDDDAFTAERAEEIVREVEELREEASFFDRRVQQATVRYREQMRVLQSAVKEYDVPTILRNAVKQLRDRGVINLPEFCECCLSTRQLGYEFRDEKDLFSVVRLCTGCRIRRREFIGAGEFVKSAPWELQMRTVLAGRKKISDPVPVGEAVEYYRGRVANDPQARDLFAAAVWLGEGELGGRS